MASKEELNKKIQELENDLDEAVAHINENTQYGNKVIGAVTMLHGWMRKGIPKMICLNSAECHHCRGVTILKTLENLK